MDDHSITQVAGALGVSEEQLLFDPAAGPPDIRPHTTITLGGQEFDTFDRAEQLRQLLESFIAVAGMQQYLRVISVAKGTVIIELEMDRDDYQRLLAADDEGKLAALGITAVGSGHLRPKPADVARVSLYVAHVKPEEMNVSFNLPPFLADVRKWFGADIRMEPVRIRAQGNLEITVEMSEEHALLIAKKFVRENQPNVVKFELPGFRDVITAQPDDRMPIDRLSFWFPSKDLDAAIEKLSEDLPEQSEKQKRDEESGRTGVMGA